MSEGKILDLFCGRGGWSKPFVEDGDSVDGVDILDTGVYSGNLILRDIREFHPAKGYDFVVGSPPCNDFSTASGPNKTRDDREPPDPCRGIELFGHALRVIGEAHPRFYALENVYRSRRFIPFEAQMVFRMSRWANRLLWTNLPLPMRSVDFIPDGKLNDDFKHLKYVEASQRRAEIPYPIARFIADTVKAAIKEPIKA